MLDENLPTFHFKPSDNSLNSVLFFTHNGSDPAPEYILRRADPSTPSGRSKYAVALTETSSSSIIYAEILVTPEWTQPTLSAAEIRAQNGNQGPLTPLIPDTVTIQLYNPDQQIKLSMVAGSWNKTDSWEFEMPEQSFRLPSASKIDQEHSGTGSPVAELTPKVVFKWKRDGKLSKDMTCYMVGRNVGGRKSKEPDITVALFKQGKNESAVTIYEPNMRRVEVEDQKGLEVVLLLGSEVIRELYLNPKNDPFNIAGSPSPVGRPVDGRRKNSRPHQPSPAAVMGSSGPTMSGAIDLNKPPSPLNIAHNQAPAPQSSSASRPDPRIQAEIQAETKRLQAMVAEEERQAREREKRDRKEAERIKKMIEQADKERRRREAEIEKETERLRKKYGVQGQDFLSPTSPQAPALPPRPGGTQLNVPAQQGGWFGPPLSGGPAPPMPPRPSSAGPFNNPSSNGWWRGPGQPASTPRPAFPPPPTQPVGPQQTPGPQSGGRRNGHSFPGQGPYGNPGASASSFFGIGHRGVEDERKKVQKKRSVHF
jgi:hypothetical protein